MHEDPPTYDSSVGRYSLDCQFDRPDSVADSIVYGVAEILDEDPVTLPPLGSVVDTDSLNRMFYSMENSESNISASFEYSGFVVTVHDHGRITFEQLD